MRFYFLIGVLLLLTTCKTDEIKPVSECDIQFDDSPYGPEITDADTTYHSPCFNPNNSNEIIYVKAYYNEHYNAELHKRNLETNKDIYLNDALVFFTPRWNKNGWIVSNHHGIFKIKENGDSLIQLNTTDPLYSPDWFRNGRNIICFKRDQADWGIFYFDFEGKNGKLLEKGHGFYPISVSPMGDKIACRGSKDAKSYISFFDTLTKEYKFLAEMNSPFQLYGVSWINNENIVWAQFDGLYKTDIQNNATKLLKSSCYARRYWRPVASPDGTKILVERDDIRKTGPSSGCKETNLYIMNADGSDERKIEF